VKDLKPLHDFNYISTHKHNDRLYRIDAMPGTALKCSRANCN